MSSDPLAGTGLRLGDVILEKFRIERVLGIGGMGLVLEATHLGLDQRVAIKLLSSTSLANPAVVARFQLEAQAAAKLKSDHVVRVMDVGTLPSGAPYMVMEHLLGRDLESLLRTDGVPPVEVAVDWLLQACEAIAEAHARGMIHRDLKPSNLFLAEQTSGPPRIKLLDFGITKDQAKAELNLTGGEAAIGSPRYMSPEQLRTARDVDLRSDLWSLGVVLYQLLSNAVPFDATTVQSLGAQIAVEDPVPLRRHRPEVPVALEAIIARCLEKDRALRVATAAELAALLVPFGPPEGAPERLERVRRAASTAVGPASLSASNPVPSPQRGKETEALVAEPAAIGFTESLHATAHNEALVATGAPPPRRRRALSALWVLVPAAAVAVVLALRPGVQAPPPVRVASPVAPGGTAPPLVTPPPAVRTVTVSATPPRPTSTPKSRSPLPKPRDPLDVQPY